MCLQVKHKFRSYANNQAQAVNDQNSFIRTVNSVELGRKNCKYEEEYDIDKCFYLLVFLCQFLFLG